MENNSERIKRYKGCFVSCVVRVASSCSAKADRRIVVEDKLLGRRVASIQVESESPVIRCSYEARRVRPTRNPVALSNFGSVYVGGKTIANYMTVVDTVRLREVVACAEIGIACTFHLSYA